MCIRDRVCCPLAGVARAVRRDGRRTLPSIKTDAAVITDFLIFFIGNLLAVSVFVMVSSYRGNIKGKLK